MKVRILLSVILCSGFLTVTAQDSKTKTDTIRRDLILEREYRPELTPSEKIMVLTDPENTNPGKTDPEFLLSLYPVKSKPEYITLPAPGLKAEFPSQKQIGYIRLGAGSKLSFLGDGQLNLLRNSTHTLDVRLWHKSIFGEMTNTMGIKERSYMNRNRLMANYKLNLPGNEIAVSVSEKYNSWNYYGTWQTPTTLLDSTLTYPSVSGQWSSDLKLRATIKSRRPDQVFTWNAGSEIHFFRLGRGLEHPTLAPEKNKGGREKEISFFGNFDYQITEGFGLGVNGNMRQFSYKKPVTYSLDNAYVLNPANTANYFTNQSLIVINPYARFSVKKWHLSAGLKVTIPSFENERISYNLTASASAPINDRLTFNALLDGGIRPVSYREGFEMNPYLDPFIHLQNLKKPIEARVSLDYRPAKCFRITPVASFERTSNAPFFYNGIPMNEYINYAFGRIFSVKYMKSNKISGGADISFNYLDKINLLGQIRYNHYINSSDDAALDATLKANGRKAWQSPGLEMRYRLDFSPVNKITLFADYRLAAMRYASNKDSFMNKMGDIHDLGLGVSWKVTKDVNIFMQVDNLLDQRYEEWNLYKSHGMTAIIGGSVHF